MTVAVAPSLPGATAWKPMASASDLVVVER